MARSLSSAGYPEAFANLIVQVGQNGEDVLIPVEGTGLKLHSLRTTLQAYFAAVKREGLAPNADKYMQLRGMHAEKVVVRIQGNDIRVSHRDHDGVGKLINAAIEKALANKSVPRHDGLGAGTQGAMLSSVPGHDGLRNGMAENAKGEDARMAGGLGDWLPGVNPSGQNIPLGQNVLQAERALIQGRKAEDRRQTPPVAEQLLGELHELPQDGKLPPIASAPGSMLDMVAAESPSAPRPELPQKYTRVDGKRYPDEPDGEPTWGFNADGEPKINQFF